MAQPRTLPRRCCGSKQETMIISLFGEPGSPKRNLKKVSSKSPSPPKTGAKGSSSLLSHTCTVIPRLSAARVITFSTGDTTSVLAPVIATRCPWPAAIAAGSTPRNWAYPSYDQSAGKTPRSETGHRGIVRQGIVNKFHPIDEAIDCGGISHRRR